MPSKKALVRRPSPRLAEGLVTHVEREKVDHGLALEQWDAYVEALGAHGWETLEVDPAEDCPDSVFVEDTVVVFRNVALITRPGAESRRAETAGVEEPVPEESGAHVVLLGGSRLLMAASAPKTAELLADLGHEPVLVDIGEFEKLEGCVTCLSVRLRELYD
ncbi:hypothetical protein [Streptomyces tendae]|uniref:hypothetical protein n=1 Tax=Streptomyces tendae TaxID=1932 RepID=UPI0033B153CA